MKPAPIGASAALDGLAPIHVSAAANGDDSRGCHQGQAAELAQLSAEELCQSMRLQVAVARRCLSAQRVSAAKVDAFASSVLAGIDAAESTFHPAPSESPEAPFHPRLPSTRGSLSIPEPEEQHGMESALERAPKDKRADTYHFPPADIGAFQDDASVGTPHRVLPSASMKSVPSTTRSSSTLGPVPMQSMGAIRQSDATGAPVHVGSAKFRHSSSCIKWETHSKEDRRKKRTARRDGARHLEASYTARTQALSSMQRVSVFRRQCQYVTRSWLFELFIMFCILSYSVWMGVELVVDVDPLVVQIVGKTFAVIFVTELSLRMVADARTFFYSRELAWNMFDLCLVVLSVLDMGLQLYTASLEGGGGGSSTQTFTSLRILRIIRITRLVRVLRIVRILRFVTALRALVYSIMFTLRSLVWALLLLLMIIYAFGMIFTTGIRDSLSDGIDFSHLGPDDAAAVEEFWSSLTTSMYTLWLAITNGVSWVEVARPLSKIHTMWSLLFTFYIGFVMFAVLNVMTGVFCQSAIEGAARDRELSAQSKADDRQTFVESARSLFKEIDEEGTGLVNYEDIEEKFDDPKVKLWLETLDIDYFDAWTFFKLIATRSTSQINVEDFVNGCMRLKGPARSIDIASLRYEQRFWGGTLDDSEVADGQVLVGHARHRRCEICKPRQPRVLRLRSCDTPS